MMIQEIQEAFLHSITIFTLQAFFFLLESSFFFYFEMFYSSFIQMSVQKKKKKKKTESVNHRLWTKDIYLFARH